SARLHLRHMKIDRRDFLVASSSAFLLAAGVQPDQAQKRTASNSSSKNSAEGKKITVFTTAKDTSYRLAATGTLSFKPMGQPLETQTCVFVDPAKRFESFLGIGGAVTDASAETFAKLPPARQQEILDAYYDPQKGIGYTLARTNIHSCDFSSESYTYVTEGDK